MTTTPDLCVELKDVSKRYGEFSAVRSLDLPIEDGSFVTLLGPSGCGKTTTLRMIAGLATITSGDIYIKGKRINDVPIHRRNLGLVFQNYSLFPHKTVFDNVAFGLKHRKVPRDQIRTRVREALEIVRLPHLEDRRPAQLSGGQQQRIALARAIVIEPDVLLLDEPLSALDANLREQMRVELKRIQRELNVTTIFVTHDQGEALALSDKIVLMHDGAIEQMGPPQEIYNSPRSRFVASFLGNSNLFEARFQGGDQPRAVLEGDLSLRVAAAPANAGGKLSLVIRAEKIQLVGANPPPDNHNRLDATVAAVDYQGQFVRYFLNIGPLQFQVIHSGTATPHREGDRIQVSIAPEDCVLLNETAGQAAEPA